MLLKLAPGVDFINTFTSSFFTHTDPKSPKRHSSQQLESARAANKMLVKSTPVVNFMNLLRATFIYLQFVLVIFWPKEIGAKAAHKMLME